MADDRVAQRRVAAGGDGTEMLRTAEALCPGADQHLGRIRSARPTRTWVAYLMRQLADAHAARMASCREVEVGLCPTVRLLRRAAEVIEHAGTGPSRRGLGSATGFPRRRGKTIACPRPSHRCRGRQCWRTSLTAADAAARDRSRPSGGAGLARARPAAAPHANSRRTPRRARPPWPTYWKSMASKHDSSRSSRLRISWSRHRPNSSHGQRATGGRREEDCAARGSPPITSASCRQTPQGQQIPEPGAAAPARSASALSSTRRAGRRSTR